MAGIRIVLTVAVSLATLLACNSNLSTAIGNKIALSETEPPVAGANGALAVGVPRATAIPLSWARASDNMSDSTELEYRVVRSLTDNIGTLADAQANGTVAVDWAADLAGIDVTGLTVLTTYYLNVLVRDRAGNAAVYAGASAATTDDTEDPIVGGGGALATGSRTMVGYTVSWTRGSDLISPESSLQYRAYTSLSPNITSEALIEANGTPNGSWTTDIAAAILSGLEDDVTYYVNVLLRDEADNRAAYTMTSNSTLKHPRIYWCDSKSGTTDRIQRADLDGQDVQNLVTTGLSNPYAIAVDPVDRKIYWTDTGTGMKKILRSDFNGQNVEDVITGLNTPYGIAVDSSTPNRYLYWTDSTNQVIYRSPLPPTSTNPADWVLLDNADGISVPFGIEVDLLTDDFYWVEQGTTKMVRKAPAATPTSITNLIISGLTEPIDIAIDSVHQVYYWTDRGTAKVQAHVYGAGTTQDLVTSELISPNGITVDPTTAPPTIYWTDADTSYIYKAPSTIVGQAANQYILITGSTWPRDIQIY